MPVMSTVEALFCRSIAWREFSARVVVPWALHGERLTGDVLEVGSGAGANAAALAATQPRISITVTDLDPAMVAAARGALSPFGDRVCVVQADSTRLPFDDDHFDGAVSFLMLHHVIAWEATIAELARVVRPGGQIVGYDLALSRTARLLHRLDRSPHRLLRPDELRRQMLAVGCRDVDLGSALRGAVVRFRATVP